MSFWHPTTADESTKRADEFATQISSYPASRKLGPDRVG